MQVAVWGAGIINVSTAWHLLERRRTPTLVDRHADAALETSFNNEAQISVSYCEPWANKQVPLKALKRMFSATSPLLFRPQFDLDQWRWGLQFLAQCNDAAFEKNVAQLVALGAFAGQIVVGAHTLGDESGDARVITQEFAKLCVQRGEQMLCQHDVADIEAEGGCVLHVRVLDCASGAVLRLQSAAYVVAYGADRAPLLKGVGLRVTILKPEQAPFVSLMDDHFKIAISRLGEKLRVAGTIELGGYDLTLDSPLAQKRCRMLRERMAQVSPRVLDTRSREEGGSASILDGFKACNAHQHVFDWSLGLGKTVDQRLPRHSGMDAWRRIVQGFGRIDGRRATGNEFQFCKRSGKPVTRRPTFFNSLAHRTRAELGHLTVAPFFRHLKNRRQTCQNPLFKPTQA